MRLSGAPPSWDWALLCRQKWGRADLTSQAVAPGRGWASSHSSPWDWHTSGNLAEHSAVLQKHSTLARDLRCSKRFFSQWGRCLEWTPTVVSKQWSPETNEDSWVYTKADLITLLFSLVTSREYRKLTLIRLEDTIEEMRKGRKLAE